LHRAGLEAALRDLVAPLAPHGIATTLDIPADLELPEAVEMLFYRGAQEALRNVTTHSRATSVEVAVTRDQGVATMRVEDDGQGFDESRLGERFATGHVGLRALGELLVALADEWLVTSAPGQGTRLVATVPLSTTAPLSAGAAR